MGWLSDRFLAVGVATAISELVVDTNMMNAWLIRIVRMDNSV